MSFNRFPYSLNSEEVHIWKIHLDTDSFDQQCLSPDEIDRKNRFKQDKHRERFANGRAALRHLIGGYLQRSPRRLQFSYNPFGKPSLNNSDAISPLFFNVSHSESLMLVAFSNTAEIGVDVEQNRELSDEEQLVRRFFAPYEQDAYFRLSPQSRTQGFFNAWTRKEAILKAKGDGLQIPLDSFSVELDPQAPCGIHNFENPSEEKSLWSLIAIKDKPYTTTALATKSEVTATQMFKFADLQTK